MIVKKEQVYINGKLVMKTVSVKGEDSRKDDRDDSNDKDFVKILTEICDKFKEAEDEESSEDTEPAEDVCADEKPEDTDKEPEIRSIFVTEDDDRISVKAIHGAELVFFKKDRKDMKVWYKLDWHKKYTEMIFAREAIEDLSKFLNKWLELTDRD